MKSCLIVLLRTANIGMESAFVRSKMLSIFPTTRSVLLYCDRISLYDMISVAAIIVRAGNNLPFVLNASMFVGKNSSTTIIACA